MHGFFAFLLFGYNCIKQFRKTLFGLKGCPREPVFAGKRFLLTVVALLVTVCIGVCRADALAAMVALRAILGAGRVRSTALLGTIFTDQTVVGVRSMSLAGAGIAVLALRAIGFKRNVLCACDGFVTVETDGAVFLRGLVRTGNSLETANVTARITEVAIRVLGAGDRVATVFTSQAIVLQRLMAVAGTNVITAVAGNVMLVGIVVRRRALKSAIFTIADRIASIGIDVSKCGITLSGFGVEGTAYEANLLFDLGSETGSGIQSYPFLIIVLGRSLVIAVLTVAIGVAIVVKQVIQFGFAFAGFRAAASGTRTLLNLGLFAGSG